MSCRKPLCLQVAEYLVGILDSFERSTTRKLVVSAFRRAGLLYDTPDHQTPHRRVTYIDHSKARPLINGTGLFARRTPVERSARGQIKIETLNSNTPARNPHPELQQPPNPAVCPAEVSK